MQKLINKIKKYMNEQENVIINNETNMVEFNNGDTAPLVTRDEVVAELGEENVINLEHSVSRPTNVFSINTFKGESNQIITFYEMNEDGTYTDGVTIEDILKVVRERLVDLNNKFESEFNTRATLNITEAINQLNARTADRINRGVEGTHQA